MNLSELEPHFLSYVTDPRKGYDVIDDLTRADGVMFLCPVCFIHNKGAVGTHQILCWQPHVPQSVTPSPGRWKFHGTGYHDLTFNNGTDRASSVKIGGACGAHFHVNDGRIDLCGDCKV